MLNEVRILTQNEIYGLCISALRALGQLRPDVHYTGILETTPPLASGPSKGKISVMMRIHENVPDDPAAEEQEGIPGEVAIRNIQAAVKKMNTAAQGK